jgi:5S rRNA maturation endonuclease (ribonuclease M5)
MNTENCAFIDALEQFGVGYRTTHRSIVIETCPACQRKWKVWMFRPDERKGGGRTGGQCWRCGERFSSFSLLKSLGFDEDEVREALRIGKFSPDLQPETWRLPDFEPEWKEMKSLEKNLKEAVVPANYFRLCDWPDHPAAEYARKRGLVAPMTEYIFLDPLTNAVAFPVTCEGMLVGFQRRFVKPLNDKLKALTDSSVPKKYSFICAGEKEGNPIAVVEGPFDAVAAAWFGWYGVCTMGSTVAKSQAQELAQMALQTEQPVYLAFDQDVAGEQGARVLAKYLDAYGIPVKRVLPRDPHIKDLSELLEKNIETAIFPKVSQIKEAERYVTIMSDWAWDLPELPGLEFLGTAIAPTVDDVAPYRAKDKSITNDYHWQTFRYPERRAKVRRYQ